MSEATTREGIIEWLRAAPSGSTHMVVVCDEFSWEDYPVYVSSGEDAREVAEDCGKKPMARVMEVYRLDYSFEKQLAMKRCHTYDLPLDGHDDLVLWLMGELPERELQRGVLDGGPTCALFQAEIARRSAQLAARAALEAKSRDEAARRAERGS